MAQIRMLWIQIYKLEVIESWKEQTDLFIDINQKVKQGKNNPHYHTFSG
jgi:hypothetical protein